MNYTYQQLFNLFAGTDYNGWILREASIEPVDKIAAMKEQLLIFNEMIAEATKN